MLLLVLVLLLYFSALFVPNSVGTEVWIPLVGGLVEGEFFPSGGFFSYLWAFLCAVVASVWVWYILECDRIGREGARNAAFLTALLLFSDPKSLCFCQLYPALLCNMLGGHYFRNRKYLNAFSLISLGSLFYIPMLWLSVAYFIVMLFDSIDVGRNIVKALCGIILPMVYILSFRFLIFGDAVEFADICMDELFELNGAFYRLPIPVLFMLICILIAGVWSAVSMLGIRTRLESRSWGLVSWLAIDCLLCTAISIVYISKEGLPFTILYAPSLASLVTFAGNVRSVKGKYVLNVLMLLLFASMVLARASYFLAV